MLFDLYVWWRSMLWDEDIDDPIMRYVVTVSATHYGALFAMAPVILIRGIWRWISFLSENCF